MKLTLNKKELTENLQDTLPILANNNSFPILANILFKVKKGSLTILATDLEIFIKKKIKLNEKDEGEFCVNGKKFYEIIQVLPKEEITLEVDKTLKIKSGKCKFELPILAVEEYPKYPEVIGDKIEFNAQELKDMLSKIVFACSEEGTRLELTGVLFDFNKNKLILVATDGRRLAMTNYRFNSEIKGKFIIPQKAINALTKISKDETKLEMIITKEIIKFNCGVTELTTRLIDAEFPNYIDIIPKTFENELKINTKDFYQAINRANVMATQDSIAITIKLEKNKITISKDTQGIGKEQEELKADYKGKEMTIGFNPKYLLDNLQVIDKEEIKIGINDKEKPVVIKIDSKFIYLLLPMLI